MATQETHTSESTVQQLLNRLSTELVIEKTNNGGDRAVVDQVPTPSEDNVTVTEMSTEVAKPSVEYPRHREHCTVRKHRKRKSYRHSSTSFTYQYKTFDIDIDRDKHPDEAERLEELVDTVAQLPRLHEDVAAITSYDELVANEDTVRKYEAIYELVLSIWSNDSLKSYAVERTARDFCVKQFPQGFYTVPGPHHENVRHILNERLEDEGLGSYSLAWGGFIVEPRDFSAVHDVVAPAYHTPNDDEILSLTR